MSSFNTHRASSAVLFFLLMLGLPSSLFSLNPQKSIAQYGQNVWLRKNGLPANAINVVLQTRDGYLWLGTSAGLFRFDGVNFTKVRLDPEEGRTNETIASLLESKDGSLWIGTGYNGLRRMKNGQLFRYGTKEGFHDTQVLSLLETLSGHLWIGTSNGAYIMSDGKFLPVTLNTNHILSLAQDLHGRIWIGSPRGVRIAQDSQQAQVINLTKGEGLPNNITTCIHIDRQGNVWIGTVNGLVCWKKGTMKVYTTLDGLSDNHIMAIYEDRDANLWVGTNRGGIDRLSSGKWTSFTNSDGLTDRQVTSITEDVEGSLWIGTSDGLNQFTNVSITTFTTYEGLANNYISSVVEAPDSGLYFLSDQGSSVTQIRDGKITKFDVSVGPACVARDGSLWICQIGSLTNINHGKVIRYDTTNGIPEDQISAITEDDISVIVNIDHSGILRFVHGKLEPYLIEGHEYSYRGYIPCLYPERKGVLWYGTGDSLVKLENGKSRGYTVADGLAGNWTNSIYDDHQGCLWISSPQGGLTRYKNGKFTPYNTKVGLFADEIYCVVGDNQGGLWLSSPSGIGFVQRQELDDFADGRVRKIHSKVYMTADGMKTDECFGSWQPAGWKTHDGHIWFATKKGAVMIDPKVFKQNPLQPPILIERVVVNQQDIPIDQFASLSPGEDKLEFHYTALSYLVPERVLFKYKLEGYDKEWVDAGTRRVAFYTGLPPNNYRFRVMACNNDGIWNDVGASFAFDLQPHFYQTYWFFGFAVIVLGAIVMGGYQIRTIQILRREKELETRIQEAMANIKVLGGLIPICSNCKKIRNDKGYWDLLEGYIQQHSEATFSHGICPDCAKLLYPDVFPLKKQV
ncbi:MAG: two-component regulator propeller domain-containing protein [Bacteroidota bacterium]